MAKILNLSKLDATEKRELVIDGVTHVVGEMTVSNFIETTRAAERISESSLVVQVEATVDLIVRSVPTVSREALLKQSLSNLSAIAAFVRGDDAGNEDDSKADGDAEDAEAKN